MKTTVKDLDEAVANLLQAYADEVSGKTAAVIESVAEGTAADLRETSPHRTGGYAGDWTYGNKKKGRNSYTMTVYNSEHYQLAHLLEFGHAKRSGGRTAPIPHIAPARERAAKSLEEKMTRGLEE